MRRYLLIGAALAGGIAPAVSLSGRSTIAAPGVPRPFDGSLSVLTYNIKGLPWPVARGRSDALRRIGAQLAAMRAAGRAPAVVVLQEAFTGDAVRLVAAAGYRYAVTGPDASAVNADRGDAAAQRFALAGSWLTGEGIGKFVGSGLVVMSDYPIVRVRAAPFPTYACAGYDCLANKGMLLATLALPDGGAVDVVTTHLNSRAASGASDARSFFAYRAEVSALERFVRSERDPAHALIVAGDFNVGHATPRAAVLDAAVARWSGDNGARDALGTFAATGGTLPTDAAWSRRRGKDWQFFDPGRAAAIAVAGIAVPFGRDASGAMLSDHVGYTAVYRLGGTAAASVTTPVRATAKASAA